MAMNSKKLRSYNVFHIRDNGTVKWLTTNRVGKSALEALLMAKRSDDSKTLFKDDSIYLAMPMSITIRPQIDGDTVVYTLKDDEFVPYDFNPLSTYKQEEAKLVDLGDIL